MESQNTQQLTDDIQKETSQNLNNSESSRVSENDGTSEDNYHDLQSNIDLNKTELNDLSGEKDVQNFSEGIPPRKKELKSCGWYNGKYICP
ncbi:hypothetical protein IQ274_20190 [Nostoc sp. LEGE 12447]|uniref:hypothetical protein n=1 Tax=Nostoc sp. LEGE 12447 TaxID=1828640 RepID=UPI001884209E|nr:hypothetical protein [Nostoc sp. LEGE 12447]MBE9000495.1 hypothetical protein [Nostoc sp. LEGE 12447]